MSTVFKFLSKNHPCHLSALSKDYLSISGLSSGHLTEIDIKKFSFIFMGESGLPNLNIMEEFWKGRSLGQIINIPAERMKNKGSTIAGWFFLLQQFCFVLYIPYNLF